MNAPLSTTAFEPFPKMARLSRECVITEKLDGTNAQILITACVDEAQMPSIVCHQDGLAMLVGSRTRWIRPKAPGEKGDPDNYGFAAWCRENAIELFKLGEGRHFGEWFGRGINRGYGLEIRRFALFNTSRWAPLSSRVCPVSSFEKVDMNGVIDVTTGVPGPACCEVVPVIWRGNFDTLDVNNAVEMLRSQGSFAVPGFMQPEGVVCYHIAAGLCFKKTLENDESPKSLPGQRPPQNDGARLAAKDAFIRSLAEDMAG